MPWLQASYIGVFSRAVVFGFAMRTASTPHEDLLQLTLAEVTSQIVRWIINLALCICYPWSCLYAISRMVLVFGGLWCPNHLFWSGNNGLLPWLLILLLLCDDGQKSFPLVFPLFELWITTFFTHRQHS